jgi:hypothetical protein
MIITRYKDIAASGIILLLIFVTEGCIKEEFDPSKFDASLELQSGLAIPVGFSHLAFEEYLTDSIIGEELRIDEDGFLSLFYSAPLDSGVMEDILSVSDTTINSQVINQTASVIFLTTPGATFNLTDSVNIPVGSAEVNARIDSIQVLSGTIALDVNSANLTGTVTYIINGLQMNGTPFSITRNLSNPDFIQSLSGYTIIPEHDLSGNNLLKCNILLTLQTPSGPVASGETILNLQTNLSNIAYETIYGDFGGFSIDLPSRNIPTPFFNKLNGGEIIFADPKFKLFFSNSAGVPFGIYFRRIDAIDRSGISHPLSGPGVPVQTSPKIIGYPALNQSGQTISDSLVLDRNNSNLPDFIASSPDSIAVEGSAEIVQLPGTATTFIRNDSRYSVSAEIEVPLWGKADFLILLDTLTFDYLTSSLPPPEEIEKLIIRTSITNSFPVTAYPQIYLLDENRVLIDSLFTGSEKIEGATDTNGDGKADPEKQAPVDIDLPRSKIDNLFATRFILVKGSIMTTDFPAIDVKLYSTYFLDYNVGLIAQIKVKTEK